MTAAPSPLGFPRRGPGQSESPPYGARSTSSVGLERSTVLLDCLDATHPACSRTRTRPRAACGNTDPSGPHSSCADSDWACHTGHPAPTTSDARTRSGPGPQKTRAHAPAGHDRSGCTSLRPAGTLPAGQERPRARRPGYHVPPITPNRAAHNAFNAQPGRTPCL